MSTISFPLTINAATTINDLANTYQVIGPTGTGSYNITLPTVPCNGSRYIFIREDTGFGTVTLSSTGGINIFQNRGQSGTTGIVFTGGLLPQSRLELQGFNSNWYVYDNKPLQRSLSKCISSVGPIAVTGTNYAGVAATRRVIAHLSYPGITAERITGVDIILQSTAAINVTGDFRPSGGATNIGNIGFVLPAATLSKFTIPVISPNIIPIADSRIEVGLTPTAASTLSIFNITLR